MRIQKKILEHFREKGFNCLTQKGFPAVIIWKTFDNAKGHPIAIDVQATIDGVIVNRCVLPFFVGFVESGPLSKKKEKEAKKILGEGRCNSFLVASADKKNLEFQEIALDGHADRFRERTIPSYCE